jgi:hypothetical protein
MFVVLFLTTELLLSVFSGGLSSRLHTYVHRLLLLPTVVAESTTARFAFLDYILQIRLSSLYTSMSWVVI